MDVFIYKSKMKSYSFCIALEFNKFKLNNVIVTMDERERERETTTKWTKKVK